jgi:outer membrane protein OmpA-like peptidoglycan-associated protein
MKKIILSLAVIMSVILGANFSTSYAFEGNKLEVTSTNAVNVKQDKLTYIVYFAPSSAELADTSKVVLDKVWRGPVDVYGYASPDGNPLYNKQISEMRANAVADYLRARGISIRNVYGKGVVGITSRRMVIVHIVPLLGE